MKLSHINKNEAEFKRRLKLSMNLASESVDTNDGPRTAAELNKRLEMAPVESNWSPLYEAAGKFD